MFPFPKTSPSSIFGAQQMQIIHKNGKHNQSHTHWVLTSAQSPGLRTAVIACGRDCRWIDSFSSTDTIIHEATTHSNTTLLQYLSLSLLGVEMNLCTVRPVLLRPSAQEGRTLPNEAHQHVNPPLLSARTCIHKRIDPEHMRK